MAVLRLLRLWDDSKIWLRCFPALRITLLCLFVRYGTRDDHIFALLPVNRRCDLMLRGQLQRVDHPKHFVKVAACRHWIDEDQFDLLIWADYVNIAHSRVICGRTLL